MVYPNNSVEISCPECGMLNYLPEDDSIFQVMSCGYCGIMFDYEPKNELQVEE